MRDWPHKPSGDYEDRALWVREPWKWRHCSSPGDLIAKPLWLDAAETNLQCLDAAGLNNRTGIAADCVRAS